ncbi:CPCC family cysteine-rich protein [Devosia riboflavina]|uniref:CPCC family cysteine-rich protein n=1 Tax=Devosia riboflavina TaxID=46914 RepID=UPI00191C589B
MSIILRFPCSCCGFLTYVYPPAGGYEVCPVCFWEDDPVQAADENYAGGANRVSLSTTRRNFREYGAKDRLSLPHVRPPEPRELPADLSTSPLWARSEFRCSRSCLATIRS